MACSKSFPLWSEVHARTPPFYCKKTIPYLGLVDDLELELRVYVLLLEGGRLYVGIAPRGELKRRLAKHWNGQGSHFTKVHKPRAVLMVWPAAHRGVEALVFQALLGQLHKVNVGDFLGGWIQTSSKLSPLQSMIFEEQRRQVREDCFRCGGGHYASACSRETSNLFCTYPCKNCGATVSITSRGEDQSRASQSSSSGNGRSSNVVGSAIPTSSASTSSASATTDRSRKRLAENACGALVNKIAKSAASVTRFGLAVNVCGKRCTALSWYLNKASPAPKLVDRLRLACVDDALELGSGDCRTLALGGFAAQGLGKPVLVNCNGDPRQRLTDGWLDTTCHAVRTGEPLRVRKASKGRVFLQRRLNQILWSVDALNAYFGHS